tara:strand:- start:161 stop:589 length:429 start_codon:yes stop_codon:yes gene_type:complete
MATTTTIYNSYKKDLFDGTIDLVNDTIKLALCTSTYTPDIDAQGFFDDITNEVTGTGYTQGGEALTSKTVTQDDTDNEGVFDAADTEWTTATITARYGILYKDTGVDSTSPLMAYIDFGEDIDSVSGNFTVAWAAEGILNSN